MYRESRSPAPSPSPHNRTLITTDTSSESEDAPADDEEDGLLKYNVFVLDASLNEMRKEMPHLMVRMCEQGVGVGGGLAYSFSTKSILTAFQLPGNRSANNDSHPSRRITFTADGSDDVSMVSCKINLSNLLRAHIPLPLFQFW